MSPNLRSLSRRLAAAGAAAAVLVVASCGGSGQGRGGDDVVVAVSAPLSSQPWIGDFIRRGAQLAVDDANREGGAKVGSARRPVRLMVMDNGGSAQEAVSNARSAVAAHAAVLLVDGIAAPAVADVTDPAHLPTFVCFQGGDDLVDPATRPTLFRMAPENRPMARRLADYIANARPKVAILSDDSTYGRDGRAALRENFDIDHVQVVDDAVVPATASDLRAQVLAARQKGADTLVVWASSADVVAAVTAARSSGWQVPVFTGPTGEDPLVRQRLAAHPDWLTGLRFVSFRITSEVGPDPFAAFRQHFEAVFGPNAIGLEQDGRKVVQPPDWPMFSFDATRLTLAALAASGATGLPLLDALETTVISGANGDERGYGPHQREGVNPSDMYFARFDGFVFRPVVDDPLSDGLPAVDQVPGA